MLKTPLLAAALVATLTPALAGETRGIGPGIASVRGDVGEAKLDEDTRAAQFQVSYGTLGSAGGKSWANGIALNCGTNGGNTVFVNGAADFAFDMGNVEESQTEKVDFGVGDDAVSGASSKGLVTWKHGFSVWTSTDREGLMKVVDALLNGRQVDFRIDDGKTDLKAVKVSLDNVGGHNDLTAFKADCVAVWNEPAIPTTSHSKTPVAADTSGTRPVTHGMRGS